MKTKLLYIVFFLISISSLSQTTYVPDDIFEQFLIDAQYDTGPLDDYVPTANIDTQSFFSEDCENLSIDNELWTGFSMYPNPTYEILTIKIKDNASYYIANINGQT